MIQLQTISSVDTTTLSTALFSAVEEASFQMCEHLTKRLQPHNTCAILCGAGDVAAYGYALALSLQRHNHTVVLVQVELPDSELAKAYAAILENHAISILSWERFTLTHWDWLIDATYRNKPSQRQTHVALYQGLSRQASHFVALHCPFGLDEQGVAWIAPPLEYELTFVLHKVYPVHVATMAKDYVGELALVAMSKEEQGEGLFFEPLDVDYVKAHLPKRSAAAHKGDMGKLLCFCGSAQRSGAAMLACEAALRSGVGTVTLISRASVIERVATRLPEVMHYEWECDGADEEFVALVQQASCIVIGCGSGRSEATRSTLIWLLDHATCPLVIDGDALFMLKDLHIPAMHPPLVLTPHLLECSRLFDYSIAQLKKNPWEIARTLSTKHHIAILLKDANTFVSSAQGQLGIVTLGNSGQAKGGSGDVLAGVVGSLIAQTKTVEPAIYLAPAVCALAANKVRAQRGEYNMLPSDVINELFRWD